MYTHDAHTHTHTHTHAHQYNTNTYNIESVFQYVWLLYVRAFTTNLTEHLLHEHTSHIAHHTSHITHHTSYNRIIHHTSHITHYTSHRIPVREQIHPTVCGHHSYQWIATHQSQSISSLFPNFADITNTRTHTHTNKQTELRWEKQYWNSIHTHTNITRSNSKSDIRTGYIWGDNQWTRSFHRFHTIRVCVCACVFRIVKSWHFGGHGQTIVNCNSYISYIIVHHTSYIIHRTLDITSTHTYPFLHQ